MASTIATFVACTKPEVHDRFPRPEPTTHASREFFGCRINGLPFIPRASSVSALGNCIYTTSYSGAEGWTFQLTSNSHHSACSVETVVITLDSVGLQEGKTYLLGSPGSKRHYGTYIISSDCSGDKLELCTSDDKPGEVTITKFDPQLRFVSGFFSFNVKDSSGSVYRVSDGLFDKLFTN